MTRQLASQSHVVIVDSCPSDYHDLAQVVAKNAWHLHFFTNGRAAIRFTQSAETCLWMINVCLPDMSGLDLLELVRERTTGAKILAIADRYEPEQERRACLQGAALYLCKDRHRTLDCKTLLTQLSSDLSVNTNATYTSSTARLDRTQLIDEVFH